MTSSWSWTQSLSCGLQDWPGWGRTTALTSGWEVLERGGRGRGASQKSAKFQFSVLGGGCVCEGGVRVAISRGIEGGITLDDLGFGFGGWSVLVVFFFETIFIFINVDWLSIQFYFKLLLLSLGKIDIAELLHFDDDVTAPALGSLSGFPVLFDDVDHVFIFNKIFEFKFRGKNIRLMKDEKFQDRTPMTKFFQQMERSYRSPVFNAESGNNQVDLASIMREQSPEQVCKKLNFTPYQKSPNQQSESPMPRFQPFSPHLPTAKKATIFIISPSRQINFDQNKTEQRLVHMSSPISSYKVADELICNEEDFYSEEEEEEEEVDPGRYQSPLPNNNVCKSPLRKLSERATKHKYLNFVTLKKPLKFASEQPRKRTNSKRRKLQTEQKPKTIVCNCKKSKCLKLYCDCFAAGQVCGKECNCCSCHNNDDHSKERETVIKQIVERNPTAFRPKVESRSNSEDEVDHKPRHFKGCNCKKSNCLKKYCECFQMGVKCSELCKCDDCKNCDHPVKKDQRKRVKSYKNEQY